MISLNLKIKTPVWTGDIGTRSDLLQTTGIIGSLRWWTEAVLRGLGKYCCDPVSDDRCPKKVNDQKQYCASCLIFGATGMRRLFRLELNGSTRVFYGGLINIKPDGRSRGWYLGSGIVGDIKLNIIPLDDSFNKNLILLPLTIAAKWGGIGAKTQHGYGVAEVVNGLNINFEEFSNSIESISSNQRLSTLGVGLRTGNANGLPKLDEMFFAKVRLEVTDNNWWKQVDGIKESCADDARMIKWVNSGSVPIAPAIKNWLRFGKRITTNKGKKIQDSLFKEVANRRISNWLFGNSRANGKTASKINISCAYRVEGNLWEFRVWGWIPKHNLPEGFDRDGFLEKLKKALDGDGSIRVPWGALLGDRTENHKLIVWREFESSRDTVKPNESKIGNYIQSLLGGEEQ